MMNLDNIPATPIPQHKLRRLAQRAVMVVERHKDVHVSLADFATAFVPQASAFVTAYDAVRTSGITRARERREGEKAISALRRLLHAWSSRLAHDVVGFEVQAFSNARVLADDVIANAARLLMLVKEHQAKAPKPLPYGDTLLAEVEAARDFATKEWEDTQAYMAGQQQAAGNLRELGIALQRSLVTLRRLLRAFLGSSHRDYQKLRLLRTSTLDEEDEEVVNGEGKTGDAVLPPSSGDAAQKGEDQAAE